MKFKELIAGLYNILLSQKAKDRLEKTIFFAALIGFFIHLIVIGLVNSGFLGDNFHIAGFNHPIESIYTPFSIILLYEIYCLIYYLPRSITIYIGKQFEIIALITIREIFDELARLNVSSDLGEMMAQPDFLYSMLCITILFILIFFYYKLNQREIKLNNETDDISKITLPENIQRYIYAKKILALGVGVIFVGLLLFSFFELIHSSSNLPDFIALSKTTIKQFFSSFYTILILNDVLVLLFSFSITDEFHKVMRNSGFVIATTLLKFSFNVTGIVSHFLVVLGVLFGTIMLAMYKKYNKIEMPEDR